MRRSYELNFTFLSFLYELRPVPLTFDFCHLRWKLAHLLLLPRSFSTRQKVAMPDGQTDRQDA